ncbi:MAG: 16S rRNA (uracil(1498)-N(3))-methyltransferase [Cyanobacteria bacterium REEB67]|nr:16S rRNA (uracil(1498)-N(3))-methyltransferase [Cyanobacteria bacterium REEB67]
MRNTKMAQAKRARYRFFIDPACIDSQSGRASSDESRLSHQVRNVLRLKAGDQAELLDGLGNLYEAQLLNAGRTYIEFALGKVSRQAPPTLKVTSCLPLIKAHRFEWALEKLTELGVSRIAPFYSERCVVKLKAGEEGRSRRWLSICKEAAEQCERYYLPELAEPLPLSELARRDERALKLILSERSKAPDMVSTLYKRISAAKPTDAPLEIFILGGPEGGFSEDEQALIVANKFQPVSLGRTILRSETACILAAGLASVIERKED